MIKQFVKKLLLRYKFNKLRKIAIVGEGTNLTRSFSGINRSSRKENLQIGCNSLIGCWLGCYKDGKIKIEKIRQMQRKVAEKPIISKNKVYIINDADTMTTEAQNCLLKTLEEPPEYITIILIASNENSILNTIKSRCTKIVFEPLSNEELKRYAQEYWKDATIPEEVFASSMGSIARLRNNIEHQELYTNVYQCINQIENKSLLDFLKQAESIAKAKEESDAVLEFLVSILFSLAKEKTEKKQNYLNCVEIVDNTKKNLQFNSNYDMQIDTMLIKMWEEIHEKSYWC